MKSNILQAIKNLSDGEYLFWINFIFYLLLLIVNPSNYFIAFSFIILFLVFYLKTKKFVVSLFYIFVSSLPILTGKTYYTQLVPAGVFSKEMFPHGYFIKFAITSTHFIALAMLLYIIRQLISKPHFFKPSLVDILLVIFYILKILSAILVSKNPELSLPFEILSLSNLIAYIYARMFIEPSKTFWKNISHLLAALVIFESLLGFTQFLIKSPLGKNIEFQVNIEYFGYAADESLFTFRPVGTFSHANTLGIWVSSVCLFLLVSTFKNKSNIIWLSFLAGCALMVATISRSAWLGFMTGSLSFIVYSARHRTDLLKRLLNRLLKWCFVIAPILLFLFIFFIIPRTENSLYSFTENNGAIFFRQIQILDAMQIIKLHPILGIGTAMSVYEGIFLNLYTMTALVPLEIHNWYLGIALENGLLTLFAFIFFLVLSLRKIFGTNKNSRVSLSVFTPITCLLTAAIFQPYINIEFILLLLSLTNSDSMYTSK